MATAENVGDIYETTLASSTAYELQSTSDKPRQSPAPIRWSQASQKRDSYVAAISTSEINLERIATGKNPSTMEEILLHDMGDQSLSGSISKRELLNKVGLYLI